MKKNGKKGNEGFSLVELIIVISIMAILMGVVGSQVIPYLEKSRQAKDNQQLSALGTSAVSAFAMNADRVDSANYYLLLTDGAADFKTDATYATDATPAGSTYILRDIADLSGATDEDIPNATLIFDKLKDNMESKAGGKIAAITIEYLGAATGQVTVKAYSDASSLIDENVLLAPVVSK